MCKKNLSCCFHSLINAHSQLRSGFAYNMRAQNSRDLLTRQVKHVRMAGYRGSEPSRDISRFFNSSKTRGAGETRRPRVSARIPLALNLYAATKKLPITREFM